MEVQRRNKAFFLFLKRLLMMTSFNFTAVAIVLLVLSKVGQFSFNADNFGTGLWCISLIYLIPMLVATSGLFDKGSMTMNQASHNDVSIDYEDVRKEHFAAFIRGLEWLFYGGVTFALSYLFII